MDKKQSRLRRAARARAKIRELGAYRLCIYRSPRHMYAQIIAPGGGSVVVSASTVEKVLRESIEGHTGNIAERARSAGVEKVAFDRSGFRYHGRLKALADAARENGLQF
jgi:large subunit ribosomal protein L18